MANKNINLAALPAYEGAQTKEQVAETFDRTPRCIEYWIEAGLPAHKVGSLTLIFPDELVDWLKNKDTIRRGRGRPRSFVVTTPRAASR